MRNFSALTLAIGIGLAGVSPTLVQAQTDRQQAAAVMRAQDGSLVGAVSLTQVGGHVLVRADAWGLSPGFHGFHVHAVGACTGDFTGAGGHLSKPGAVHAGHDGDMPSLYVDSGGTATLQFETDRFTVADLFDGDGSAVIIHAGPDNFGNIPTRYAPEPDATTLATGDAGARAACGVVE
jgi:Cu-Zn family superoxide dismutase